MLKKIIIISMCFFLGTLTDSFAKNNCLNNNGDCCDDAATNTRYGCGTDNCGGGNHKKGEGFRILCGFPKASTCRTGNRLQDDYWRNCSDYYCSGYSADIYDATTMEPEIRNVGSDPCWAYKCKTGTINYNGKCITETECRAISGMDIENGSCVSSKWCDDTMKTSYNASIHDKNTVGTCSSYVCKQGFCFESAAVKTCVNADPQGTFGGKYANVENGVCMACPANQYVNANFNGCSNPKTASMAQIQTCANCIQDEDFKKCISNGTKCSVSIKSGK